MCARHHSSLVCESSIVTNLPPSQVLVCESRTLTNLSLSQILVTELVSEPPGLVLNESEPCTPPNLRVMAKEKLVQGSTRPLQVYSRRKVPIFQPICVQEFEPVSVNEVPFLPLLFLTLNYHTKAYLTQMTMI